MKHFGTALGLLDDPSMGTAGAARRWRCSLVQAGDPPTPARPPYPVQAWLLLIFCPVHVRHRRLEPADGPSLGFHKNTLVNFGFVMSQRALAAVSTVLVLPLRGRVVTSSFTGCCFFAAGCKQRAKYRTQLAFGSF